MLPNDAESPQVRSETFSSLPIIRKVGLTKIPEKLSKKGGYRARVLDNGVVNFDKCPNEDIDKYTRPR